MKDIGPVKIKLEEAKVELKQEKYIEKLLIKFGMEDCEPSVTPIEPHFKLEKGKGDENLPYQNLIGSLMFLRVATRPAVYCLRSAVCQNLLTVSGPSTLKQQKES
ncbi:unnamed protein product [Arctia plantaginis]|uniref:Reverse transcriptase n=1 Tax=Arctia plantaginis TaxID=874455 RepID=A0A8S0YT76_ARCPL|nr:unnamed protein product [Arctia plantaginis]